jgi:class 3 adenylate cyclase
MGGVRQKVCVLFSDIRGFTTRSEKEQPEQIVALLNRYFEEMAQAVHAHNGTLDKFIGDGLMAFFGVPGESSNPARDALAAAQDMLRRLKELNLRLAADGIPEVEIGIGLHLGEAVVGHVGSSQRHEYTAIGDVVNLAARLEGLTKDAGFPLVCSQEVMDASDGAMSFIPLGDKPIKGRSAVPVFGLKPL